MKNDKTLANGYSSESNQQDLSNEYQHDRVENLRWFKKKIFASLCIDRK